MSDKSKRNWLSIAAVVVATIITAGAAYALLGTDPTDEGPSRPGLPEAVEDPELPQAAWTLKTFAAGTAGPPKPGDRKAVRREKQALITTVTTVADTLILAPTELEALAGRELSTLAAKALARSDLPFPEGLTDVQAIRKKASIGLDPKGRARAAARVTLLVKANTDSGTARIVGDSNLYLEKRKGRWQVVAFDGTRAPKTKGKNKKGGKG